MNCFKQLHLVPFLFSLQFLFGYAAVTDCPVHWRRFGTSCYIKVDTAVTWTKANGLCKLRYGGQLARIETNTVHLFLFNEFVKNGQRFHWFGLRRCGENKWCFPDWNIAGPFSNWNKGQPDNYGGNEGCAHIRLDGYWNDLACSNKLPFICQKKESKTLTINLQPLKNEHSKILQKLENNKQAVNVSLNNMENTLSNVMEEIKMLLKNEPKLGSYQNPGRSCLDILTHSTGRNALSNGEYWIIIDRNGPLKVFCDMKTDGGGWTLVTNIALSNSNGFNWVLATDYRQISDYNQNNLGVSTLALGALKSHMPFTQLRFHCHKKVPGRTFHIVTKNNIFGQHVSQYFTGKSNIFPKACGSFTRLNDDNSTLAQECAKWGYENGKYFVGKWSNDGKNAAERLYNHAAFVGYKAHWIVPLSQGGRWECDDYLGVRSAGDFWKIYVR